MEGSGKIHYLASIINSPRKTEVKEFEQDLTNIPKENYLIAVKYAGLGHFDLQNLESGGQLGPLGIEGSGVIIQAGEGCDRSLVGQNCTFVPKVFEEKTGSYCQLTIKHKDNVIPVGDLDLKQAAYLLGNPLTAYYLFEIFIRERNVKCVLQDVASSALGKMTISLCLKNGIKILNIVRKSENIKLLEEIGATLNFNSSDPNFNSSIFNAIKEHKPTLYLSYLGGRIPSVLFEKLPNDSSMVIVGNVTNTMMSGFSSLDFIFKEKKIETFAVGKHMQQISSEKLRFAINAIIESIKNGENNFVTSITKEFYLFEQFEEALKKYNENQSEGKIIFKLNN
jgi:NADPH:quinone reductase-like Zn-dependent oxidoreductase